MLNLNIAIIGCGYWGQKLLETALNINAFTSIKIYDSNVDVVNLIKKKYPQIFCYPSFEELLNDHNTTAVMVATELKQHFYLCEQLLQANKHVLCEKPLAYTAKECNQLGVIANKNSKVLMVGHTYLFNKTIKEIKSALIKNNVGSIKHLSFQRFNYGPVRADTDVVYDLATHDISIAIFLLESLPLSVSANANYILGSTYADSCSIHLKFPDNICVDISVSWVEPNKTRIMKIIGDKGSVYFDEMSADNKAVVYKYKSILSKDIDNNEKLKCINLKRFNKTTTSPLHNEMIHFAECILNNRTPESNWETAKNVVKIIEAIEKSIVRNGRTVKV